MRKTYAGTALAAGQVGIQMSLLDPLTAPQYRFEQKALSKGHESNMPFCGIPRGHAQVTGLSTSVGGNE